ncbi:MAG: hypothetical protein GF350_07245 [Chitinivibrionales bacterium]|nr:hypothetical protein [Chitinivibrionales bacterium]
MDYFSGVARRIFRFFRAMQQGNRGTSGMFSSLFWVSLFLIHCGVFIWQCKHQNLYTLDSPGYLSAAENINKYGILLAQNIQEPVDPANYTVRPPLYVIFIAIIKRFTSSHLWIILFQNILSIFNIFLALKTIAIVFHSAKPYLLMFALIVLFPSQLIYTNMIMSEILFQTWLICMVFFWVLYVYKGGQKFLVLYTFSLIAGMLTKPVLFPFTVVNMIFMIILSVRKRSWSPLLWACSAIACVVIYSGWNARRTGYFHFSSITTFNSLNTNCYYLLRSSEGPARARKFVDSIFAQSDSIANFEKRQRFISQAAFEQAKKHLPHLMVMSAKGVLNFFIDPGRYDLYALFGKRNDDSTSIMMAYTKYGYKGIWNALMQQPKFLLLILLLTATANVIKLGLLLLFPFNKAVLPPIRIMIMIIISYIVLITGMLGGARFAMPLFPLVMITTYGGGGVFLQLLARARSKMLKSA